MWKTTQKQYGTQRPNFSWLGAEGDLPEARFVPGPSAVDSRLELHTSQLAVIGGVPAVQVHGKSDYRMHSTERESTYLLSGLVWAA